MDDRVPSSEELAELFREPEERVVPKVPRSAFVIAALVLLAILWSVWAGAYTTWLWFEDLGYQTVFSVTLGAQATFGIVTAVVAAVALWLSFRLALRLSPRSWSGSRVVVVEGQRVQIPDLSRAFDLLALPVALLVAFFAGSIAWGGWDVLLAYWYQVPFGETDPVFGRDVAYYVFTLPALELVANLLFALLVAALVGSAAIHFARSAQGLQLAGLARGPRIHLLALVAALFLVLAWQAYLAIPALLYGGTGPVTGASYTDLHARMPMLWAQVGAAVVAAGLVLAAAFTPRKYLLSAAIAIYGIAIVAGWIYPATMQRFSVAPNELVKETPYIEQSIAATRKAYGLDQVEERELSGEATLSAADISANSLTIDNIRLWDQQPLLDTFAQIQEIRTYYDFPSVDNDRYRVDGEIRQVMLSARELSAESLPNRNWINEHLTFTHGFGVTVGPVNEVTSEGLPVLFVKDIPPTSSVPSLEITRPEIYFGEMSNERVYVGTKAQEFNYPSGEQNIFESYAGEGGISIGSTLRQLLFATRFGDLKLLLADDLTAESRVLFNRNIRERLAEVAPFLLYDSDPYLVISEGRLYWIADAYTVSDRYPYSQPARGGINYIRNSVKAVVDAYHGHVRFYVADEGDAIIRTYARIFPDIFRPLSEMPEGLRAHIRYPEDIFKLQTAIYSTYHMDSPQVFYNKEDQWTVAATNQGSDAESGAMEPYYTVMKLPGEQTEEFILMLPFTPQRKDNLASWMAARADGENYGKLVVYRFPKQKLVFGPRQVSARINQDPEISRQVSLWNQRGSQAIFGTLMVIPVEESLVYVQPLYLRAENGKIPELRRVIAVAENRIAMEPTLDMSLARIFGDAPPDAPQPQPSPAPGGEDAPQPAPPPPPVPSGDAAGAVERARGHYERALQAQREGDWARYGEEIRLLGEALQQGRAGQ